MPSAQIAPPVGGWNTFDPLVGMGPEFAPVLDNLMPAQAGMRMRPGYRTWASGLPGRVDGLLFFESGRDARLFAAAGNGIYDVTAGGAVTAPVVTGASSARWDGLMIAAAGGQFLLAFNGLDQPQQFDGSAWSPWTGTGVPVQPGWANVFKGRPYVGRRDQLSFWYGVPGAIGGAFIEFPFQGVAKRGGGIAAMATWTLDGGQGIDDYAVFLTTQGELLVYRGTNPSNPATWALVGVYQMPRPLGGTRFVRQFGGDVLVLTEGGVFSLRVLLSGTDLGALAGKAYTRLIEPSFLDLARQRGEQSGWDLVPLPAQGVWLVNVPFGAIDAQQVAFRAASGAAARFTGLPAACWIEAGGRAFFGHASDGRVMLWGEDVGDAGAAVSCECIQAFSSFGSPGLVKRFTLAEPVVLDAAGTAVSIEMLMDWQIPPAAAVTAGPNAPPVQIKPNPATLVWGSGLWGVGRWAGLSGEVARGWRAVRGIGQTGAVRLRMTAQATRPSWLGTGVVWERGGPLR